MPNHRLSKVPEDPRQEAQWSPKLPIGIGDFKKVVEGGYASIDKSLFIQAILNEPAESVLITRPRRFAKSYNLSMLRYFFDQQGADRNRKLFTGSFIEKAKTRDDQDCMNFQGKYPTVWVTFKDIRAPTFNDFLKQLATKMSDLYAACLDQPKINGLQLQDRDFIENIIMRKADVNDLALSLQKLTAFLHAINNRRVMLLFDEYDTPLHTAFTCKQPYHNELADFMKVFMGAAFKDNTLIQKGVITGILRIGLMDLFSGVNSISVYTMMKKRYGEYFGFSESETRSLVRQHSKNLTESQFEARMQAVKDWYNGYTVGDAVLYNPWSILQYLNHENELAPYWVTSGEDGLLGRSLLNAQYKVREHLLALLEGKAIDVTINESAVLRDLQRNTGALWHLMISSGYLKVIANKSTAYEERFTVMIPNKELIRAYRHMVENWFQKLLIKPPHPRENAGAHPLPGCTHQP